MEEAFIESEGDESLTLPEDEEDKSNLEIVSEEDLDCEEEETYFECEDEESDFECEDEEPNFECEDKDAALIERVGKSDNRPTSNPECELKENQVDETDPNLKLVTKKRKRRVKRREIKNENLNSTEEDETDHNWKLVTKTRHRKQYELKRENVNNEDKVQKKTETVQDGIIDVSSSWKRSNLPVGYERKIQKTTTEAVKDENYNGVDFEIIPYQHTGIDKKEYIKQDQYFGSTSDLNDRYFANDYQKGDIIQHLTTLGNNLERTNSDSVIRKTNQESTVADILDLAARSNSYGSNSNVLGLSNLNVYNGSFSLNIQDNCPSTFEQALIMGCEGFRENRRSSSTESGTSGISSVSPLSSISDLMNNINIGTTIGQGSGVASTTPPINNGFTCRPDDHPVLPFFSDRRWSVSSVLNSNYGNDLDFIERDAKLYRRAAAFSEANCTWIGPLPPRSNWNPTYSCKVFLGGVPRDITEAELIEAFAPFGPIRIVWPGKDNGGASCSSKAGYNYIIFESEKQVEALLQACTQDCSNGGNWYFKISSRTRSKEVQVIPWDLNDSNFIRCSSERQGPCKTIFVGALHGMLNAEGLAMIMNDLFGGVVYAGIDTDKYKYPIGSGRVTFNNHKSYMKAVSAAVIEIRTPKFTKRVQLDPYIEDAICSGCQIQQGPFFCRDLACFRYFCHSCWNWQHMVDTLQSHKPMMRNKTNRQVN